MKSHARATLPQRLQARKCTSTSESAISITSILALVFGLRLGLGLGFVFLLFINLNNYSVIVFGYESTHFPGQLPNFLYSFFIYVKKSSMN